VELSPVGIALSKAEVQSRLRADRVCEIRAEIKAGVYETSKRIDGTVERLIEVFRRVGRTEAQAVPDKEVRFTRRDSALDQVIGAKR